MVKLSDPITIRDIQIKNRLGYPPMLTFSSNRKGLPTKATFGAYELKARGGAGLITYENTTPQPVAVTSGGLAHIGTDEDIPKYKKLTDMIHQYDTKIGMQIGFGGILVLMFSGLLNYKMDTFGPSSIDSVQATSAHSLMVPSFANNLRNLGSRIIELDVEQIIDLENIFAEGAKRVIEAGFDYVDIHSGHGMLHYAFLSRFYNRRTDEYGGSIENRCRFLVESIKKMRKAIGEKPPIFVRYSADGLLEDDNTINDGIKIAQVLEKAGADCLDITQGVMVRSTYGIEIPTYYDHGCFIHFAEAIKKVVNIPVIGVGRIIDPRMADEFIQQGKADIIYMGRQLLCDPDTPNKYFTGKLEDIKHCLGCLQTCNKGFCLYDSYGGVNYKELTSSTDLKKIVILGAGIAGMEAARVAKLRNHDVEIYEKTDKVGGLIPIVAAEYKKEDFMNIVNYLENQLKKLEVPIHLNRDLTKEEIAALDPDILVLATGSKATVPVNLKEKPNILTPDETILKNKHLGKDIVVWGLGTFWGGGAETAITLSEEGYNVKALVGPERGVALSLLVSSTGRVFSIITKLKERNIPIYPRSKLLNVSDNNVKFLDENQNEVNIQADNLIYCGARISSGKTLKEKYNGVVPEIVLIGDCREPRDIQVAMNDAQTFARGLK